MYDLWSSVIGDLGQKKSDMVDAEVYECEICAADGGK